MVFCLVVVDKQRGGKALNRDRCRDRGRYRDRDPDPDRDRDLHRDRDPDWDPPPATSIHLHPPSHLVAAGRRPAERRPGGVENRKMCKMLRCEIMQNTKFRKNHEI